MKDGKQRWWPAGQPTQQTFVITPEGVTARVGGGEHSVEEDEQVADGRPRRGSQKSKCKAVLSL